MAIDTTIGGANSDSYVNEADARAYWDLVGFVHAAFTSVQVEQALRRATRYIDAQFRDKFPGVRDAGRAQALEWPRKTTDGGAVSDRYGNEIALNTIPKELVIATAEAAAREVSGTSLSPDIIPATGGKVIREKVGPLEVEYSENGTSTDEPQIKVIEDILGTLFQAAASTTKFVERY